jgi:hypothetical protein
MPARQLCSCVTPAAADAVAAVPAHLAGCGDGGGGDGLGGDGLQIGTAEVRSPISAVTGSTSRISLQFEAWLCQAALFTSVAAGWEAAACRDVSICVICHYCLTNDALVRAEIADSATARRCHLRCGCGHLGGGDGETSGGGRAPWAATPARMGRSNRVVPPASPTDRRPDFNALYTSVASILCARWTCDTSAAARRERAGCRDTHLLRGAPRPAPPQPRHAV